MENNFARLLPSNIALDFEGQTTSNAHYVQKFNSFFSGGIKEFCSVWLDLSSLKRKIQKDVNAQSKITVLFVSSFSKSSKNVVAMIRDNVFTNKFIAI